MRTDALSRETHAVPIAEAAKSVEMKPRRSRLIRLDRHIRQAEWAELLRGRN